MIRISRPEAKREFQKTPAEIIAGVEEEPGGMKLHEVVRPLNDIAVRYEVAALTIAEPMPRLAIRIRNMNMPINIVNLLCDGKWVQG